MQARAVICFSASWTGLCVIYETKSLFTWFSISVCREFIPSLNPWRIQRVNNRVAFTWAPPYNSRWLQRFTRPIKAARQEGSTNDDLLACSAIRGNDWASAIGLIRWCNNSQSETSQLGWLKMSLVKWRTLAVFYGCIMKPSLFNNVRAVILNIDRRECNILGSFCNTLPFTKRKKFID